jgi:hypothetical protein
LQARGDAILEPGEFEKTDYYRNAAQCIAHTGNYFACRRPSQVIQVARSFAAQFRGEPLPRVEESEKYSRANSLITVRPIALSDCHEIYDGNHRLAIEMSRGKTEVKVRFVYPETMTPLQQMLMDQTWVQGRKELYQPIDSPELEKKWKLVRRCSDRLDFTTRFLKEMNLLPPVCSSYLDVGANYGWFVWQLGKLGFDACGVEIDLAACDIGRLVYGLKPRQAICSEVVAFLETEQKAYDVVTCFSLLHHFVRGLGAVSGEELLGLIDRLTKRVFIFDMGQGHEEWFKDQLAQFNPRFIRDWVLKNTSFNRIQALGVDRDSVPPFERNYGRTTFACWRE